MRAAVLTAVNEPLEVLDVEVDAPRANEVLIRTSAAGVCHSDMHFQEGKYPSACPIVLGHEGAGIVEAVGSDVTYVRPGDPVITCVSMSCGECRTCLRGKPYLCALSEAIAPGIYLPAGGLLPLRDGGILQASLIPGPIFQNFSGALDANGTATPTLLVPPVPLLAGLDLYVAALSFDVGPVAERQISNWVRTRLRL